MEEDTLTFLSFSSPNESLTDKGLVSFTYSISILEPLATTTIEIASSVQQVMLWERVWVITAKRFLYLK